MLNVRYHTRSNVMMSSTDVGRRIAWKRLVRASLGQSMTHVPERAALAGRLFE